MGKKKYLRGGGEPTTLIFLKLKIKVLGVGGAGKGWRLGSVSGALPEAWDLCAFFWEERAQEFV